MSGMEILGNTETQHSDFRYKKTSVSVNPKYKEKSHQKKRGHSLQMQEDKFKNSEVGFLQRAVYHSPRTPQSALAIHSKD